MVSFVEVSFYLHDCMIQDQLLLETTGPDINVKRLIVYCMFPVNMPGPIRKRFGYGRLWPSRPACSQKRPGSYVCQIRLSASVSVPLFSKCGMDHIAQNRPGSNLGGLVRVWPNAPGLEASWCERIIGPGFWQDATRPLPVSHF